MNWNKTSVQCPPPLMLLNILRDIQNASVYREHKVCNSLNHTLMYVSWFNGYPIYFNYINQPIPPVPSNDFQFTIKENTITWNSSPPLSRNMLSEDMLWLQTTYIHSSGPWSNAPHPFCYWLPGRARGVRPLNQFSFVLFIALEFFTEVHECESLVACVYSHIQKTKAQLSTSCPLP